MDVTPKKTVQITHLRADEIYLTGDFNRWSVPGLRMREVRRGCWETEVGAQLAMGRLACAAMIQGRVIEVISLPIDKKHSDQQPSVQG